MRPLFNPAPAGRAGRAARVLAALTVLGVLLPAMMLMLAPQAQPTAAAQLAAVCPAQSTSTQVAAGGTQLPNPRWLPLSMQQVDLDHGDVSKQFGVSVAGAEFGDTRLPGVLDTDYVYAGEDSRQRYFAAKGLTLVRIPFRWERLQPTPFAPLSEKDVSGLRSMLDAAQAAGQQVILDLHNYGRYYNTPMGYQDAGRFADFWQRVACEFKSHPAVYGYELMNEPHDLPDGSAGWAYLAQAATNAVRTQDQRAWILVPGYGWQTAAFWPGNNPTLDVRDPARHMLYAAHQYFDADHSGAYSASYDASGATPSIGADRIQPFVTWLAERGARGILTEYGVPASDPRWLDVLDRFLAAASAEPRLVGGTYWAAGPWWRDYPLSVEPRDGQDRPQMMILTRYRSR